MNENLISIQENFKNWVGGGGGKNFFWLPEIFAGYQLFLNPWSPDFKHNKRNWFTEKNNLDLLMDTYFDVFLWILLTQAE